MDVSPGCRSLFRLALRHCFLHQPTLGMPLVEEGLPLTRRELAAALEGISYVLTREGHLEVAAQCLGAAKQIRLRLNPVSRDVADSFELESLPLLQARMNEEALVRAMAQGASMTLDQLMVLIWTHPPTALVDVEP